MFGIFYTLLTCVGSSIAGIRNEIRNRNINSNNKMNSTDGLYRDHRGAMRYVSNNHQVMIRNINGVVYYIDLQTGEKRNMTLERFNENQNKYLEKHPETKIIQFGIYNHNRPNEINGYRYKNLETGEIYICRDIYVKNKESGCECLKGKYYLNMDGKIVKPVIDMENWEEFADFFNNYQDNWLKHLGIKNPKELPNWKLSMYYGNEKGYTIYE